MSETKNSQIENLEAAIATATENIKKATALRLTGLAQQIRRERKQYSDKLALAQHLLATRPINWDEMGSSSKDLWEDRAAASFERRAQRAAVLAHLTVENTEDGIDAEAAYMKAFGE